MFAKRQSETSWFNVYIYKWLVHLSHQISALVLCHFWLIAIHLTNISAFINIFLKKQIQTNGAIDDKKLLLIKLKWTQLKYYIISSKYQKKILNNVKPVSKFLYVDSWIKSLHKNLSLRSTELRVVLFHSSQKISIRCSLQWFSPL